MLNVIAFGPRFFESISGLNANEHRHIVRDLLNSKFVYTAHKSNSKSSSLLSIVDALLGLHEFKDFEEPKENLFNQQSIKIWINFFAGIYKEESRSSRLVLKDYHTFFAQNECNSEQIWIHPNDAIDFGLPSNFYSKLCFPQGRPTDEFHEMVLRQGRFSKAFMDFRSIGDLLHDIDQKVLQLPAQFFKTIILFDKYLSYSFSRFTYHEDHEDNDLDGFARFLCHLSGLSLSDRELTSIVLVGPYPQISNSRSLLVDNKLGKALVRLREKVADFDFLDGIQFEIIFVCPNDFPDVLHDRYCAWSSWTLDHSSDFFFHNLFEDCLGTGERVEPFTDFWLDGGRGFQVYGECRGRRTHSFQHVTFNWQPDIMAMEDDLIYRFFSWPSTVKNLNYRQEWAKIKGNSGLHGFSKPYSMTF